MAINCLNDNHLDNMQCIPNSFSLQSLCHRQDLGKPPLQWYGTAQSSHLRRVRRTLKYVPVQTTSSDSVMALVLHPCALLHFPSIQKLGSISSALRFSYHNRPAASNARKCLTFALQPGNYFAWMEQYSFTSVSITFPFEYGLPSSIILPPI